MLSEQAIRLPNGVTLRYVEQGPAGAIPIILLHGFPDSWRSYETVMAHLPPSIRVIAPSQRGFGSSDKPVMGYHPRDLAADLAEFMNLRRIPEAIVAGHSMGALVAQRLALDFPDRVAGLVLIGTFKSQADNAELREMIASLDTMKDPVDADLVHAFQASTIAQHVPEKFFATILAESARVPIHVWRAVLKAILPYDDFAELPKISAPSMLCWGERDGFSTYEQRQEIAQAIAGTELRVYAGAGHSLQWEEPQRFAADLVSFMNTVGRRRLVPKARA
jgi:non-heme chloroperoxidase